MSGQSLPYVSSSVLRVAAERDPFGSFSKARKSPPALVRMPVRWVLYSTIAAPDCFGV